MAEVNVPVDELMRIYTIHQKNLEKARLRNHTEEAKRKNREAAKLFYSRHREEVLAKRAAMSEEKKRENNQKSLERYHAHREEILAKRAAYRETHKDEIEMARQARKEKKRLEIIEQKKAKMEALVAKELESRNPPADKIEAVKT